MLPDEADFSNGAMGVIDSPSLATRSGCLPSMRRSPSRAVSVAACVVAFVLARPTLGFAADPKPGETSVTPPVPVSAITGEGLDALLAIIEAKVAGELGVTEVLLAPDQLGLVDWVYRNGDVVSREDREDGGVTLKVRTGNATADEIRARLARKA